MWPHVSGMKTERLLHCLRVLDLHPVKRAEIEDELARRGVKV